MKIVIIRHAEPDYEHNTLTPHGFIEAKALGDFYDADDFDEIYCSTLNRAVFTCDAIVKGKKKYEKCDWLEEISKYPITVNGNTTCAWDFMPDYFEKMENIYDFNKYADNEVLKTGNFKEHLNEIYKELELVLNKNGYYKENGYFRVEKANKKTILLVCHWGMMSVLMSYFMNIPFCVIANHMCCLPTGVTTFVSEERQEGIAHFRMLKFGDTTHLKVANVEESFHARFCETFDSEDRH